jgi:replicative DNA helicase
MVCFIHRPEYYKITEDDKGNSLVGLAEIIIAKHRNGAVGDVRLRFKAEYAKFMNIDDDYVIKDIPSKMNDPIGGGDFSPINEPAYPTADQLVQSNGEVPF